MVQSQSRFTVVHCPWHLRDTDSSGEYADYRPVGRTGARDGHVRPASCYSDESNRDSSWKSTAGVPGWHGRRIAYYSSGNILVPCTVHRQHPGSLRRLVLLLALDGWHWADDLVFGSNAAAGTVRRFSLYGPCYCSLRLCYADCQHAADGAIHHVARSIALFS